MLFPPSEGSQATTGSETTSSGKQQEAPKPIVYAEVVYVLLEGWDNSPGFCTGTLIAKDTVVTAGHCLEWSIMKSFEIVAPNAPGRPRVTASKRAIAAGDYDNPGSPDFGLLTLDTPIELAEYGQLTDVVGKVEAGEQVRAVAMIRTVEEAESQLRLSESFPVSSTVKYGYTHGFATPLFSKAGDSGAGLFLFENGQLTHKLIGIARQPEPARAIDHFTRIDPTMIKWVASNSSASGGAAGSGGTAPAGDD